MLCKDNDCESLHAEALYTKPIDQGYHPQATVLVSMAEFWYYDQA